MTGRGRISLAAIARAKSVLAMMPRYNFQL